MNCRLLKRVMAERGIKVKKLAILTGIKSWRLHCCLWHFGEFKAWEIARICRCLGIFDEGVEKIFFAKKFPKGNKT